MKLNNKILLSSRIFSTFYLAFRWGKDAVVPAGGTSGEPCIQALLSQGHPHSTGSLTFHSRSHRTVSSWVLSIPRVETSQSIPVFNHPYNERSLLIMFKHIFLCFGLCLMPLVLSLGAMEKSLAVWSLLLSLLFSRMNSSTSQLLLMR